MASEAVIAGSFALLGTALGLGSAALRDRRDASRQATRDADSRRAAQRRVAAGWAALLVLATASRAPGRLPLGLIPATDAWSSHSADLAASLGVDDWQVVVSAAMIVEQWRLRAMIVQSRSGLARWDDVFHLSDFDEVRRAIAVLDPATWPAIDRMVPGGPPTRISH